MKFDATGTMTFDRTSLEEIHNTALMEKTLEIMANIDQTSQYLAVPALYLPALVMYAKRGAHRN